MSDIVYGIYRYKKTGKEYLVLKFALTAGTLEEKHSEEREVVIYQDLSNEDMIFVKLLSQFKEEFERV